MQMTTWQDTEGLWHARDYVWFCSGSGATIKEAEEEVERKVAEIEKQEAEDPRPKYF